MDTLSLGFVKMKTRKQEVAWIISSIDRRLGNATVYLEKWAPGDGWTRYTVRYLANDIHESYEIARGLSLVECHAFLQGYYAGLNR